LLNAVAAASNATGPLFLAAALWSLILIVAAVQTYLTFGVDWRAVPEVFHPNAASEAGVVAGIAMSSIGALIVYRQPANRIGWLLLTIALSAAFIDFPRLYAGFALYLHPSLPGALWLYWLNQIVWILLFTELLVLLSPVVPGRSVTEPALADRHRAGRHSGCDGRGHVVGPGDYVPIAQPDGDSGARRAQ